MKNKKLQYILIPAVLAIWGLIGWKIVNRGAVDELPDMEVSIPARGSQYTVQVDTFSLHTGYSDPFLDRSLLKRKSSSNISVENIGNRGDRQPIERKQAQPKPKPQPVIWPEVACLGRIANKSSTDEMVIVQVDGRESSMRQGDILMNMELLTIGSDSIVLKYKEETKALALN